MNVLETESGIGCLILRAAIRPNVILEALKKARSVMQLKRIP